MYFVRELQSNRFTPDVMERLGKEYPAVVRETADSMHDIAWYAPGELIAAVASFISKSQVPNR